MHYDILEEIGLTKGEISVYIALLEHGNLKSGQISKYSGVHTSKVYPILERLIQKGLASYIIENNIRLYQASDPNQIIEYIHKKKLRLEEQEDVFKKELPSLMIKQKLSVHKPFASIYEGVKGIAALFNTMLEEWQPGEEYLVFSPGDEFRNEEINTFFKKHHLRRIEKGVIVKSLSLESQRNFYKKAYANTKNFVFRFTDNSLPAGINIVHNKVSTLIWDPYPVAFVIDSADVAKKYRLFFMKLWKEAKE